MLEKIPPQSLEAEQACLGAMLLEAQAIDQAELALREADFYREAHRMIFRGILALHHSTPRIPVDLITLGEWLRERDELEMIGGTLYLTTIMCQVPTAAGIGHYATIVRTRSRQRQLITAADTIMHLAYAGDSDIDAVQEQAETLVQAVGDDRGGKGPRHIGELAAEVFNRTEDAIDAGQDVGLKTRWAKVNKLITGIRPGQSIMIAARSGMGKTAFGLQLADTWAQWGEPGLIFSLEMEESELTTRELLAYTTQLTNHALDDMPWLQANKERALIELGRAVERTWELPIWIDDRTDLSTTEIEATIRRYHRESRRRYGKPLRWVVLDFAQLARPSVHYRTRPEEVGRLAYELKYLPKRQNLSLVSLVQVNRDGKERSTYRPQDDDLGESDKLLWSADKVLYLYRPGYYGDQEIMHALLRREENKAVRDLDDAAREQRLAPLRSLMEVGVLKQRAGRPKGRQYLNYDGDHYYFGDATPAQWAALKGEDVKASRGDDWAGRYGDA